MVDICLVITAITIVVGVWAISAVLRGRRKESGVEKTRADMSGREEDEREVLIIGAGILGASLATTLARAGRKGI